MKRVALVLPGGGVSGALYQVGALAALEDGTSRARPDPGAYEAPEPQQFACYIGHASGSILAAALAGGISANRLYRALLDPADPFFPLERRHVLAFDTDEWQRMLKTALLAVRYGVPGLGKPNPLTVGPAERVMAELDRLADSLPAGLFKLDRFERFLGEFFARRDIPNAFSGMPRPLRVIAHDLDSGAKAVFGGPGLTHVPLSLACAASCALPLFFSPVRIGDRHYVDGGLCSMTHFDVAAAEGAEFAIVVNPRVPVSTRGGAVPTGHGAGRSVRDKGLLWINNQARRMANQAMLDRELASPPPNMGVLLIQPRADDTPLFLTNQRSFEARRQVLEHAYRTTRARLSEWLEENAAVASRVGLSAKA